MVVLGAMAMLDGVNMLEEVYDNARCALFSSLLSLQHDPASNEENNEANVEHFFSS